MTSLLGFSAYHRKSVLALFVTTLAFAASWLPGTSVATAYDDGQENIYEEFNTPVIAVVVREQTSARNSLHVPIFDARAERLEMVSKLSLSSTEVYLHTETVRYTVSEDVTQSSYSILDVATQMGVKGHLVAGIAYLADIGVSGDDFALDVLTYNFQLEKLLGELQGAEINWLTSYNKGRYRPDLIDMATLNFNGLSGDEFSSLKHDDRAVYRTELSYSKGRTAIKAALLSTEGNRAIVVNSEMSAGYKQSEGDYRVQSFSIEGAAAVGKHVSINASYVTERAKSNIADLDQLLTAYAESHYRVAVEHALPLKGMTLEWALSNAYALCETACFEKSQEERLSVSTSLQLGDSFIAKLAVDNLFSEEFEGTEASPLSGIAGFAALEMFF